MEKCVSPFSFQVLHTFQVLVFFSITYFPIKVCHLSLFSVVSFKQSQNIAHLYFISSITLISYPEMDSWLSFQSTFLVLVFVIFMVFVEVPVSLCSHDSYSSCSSRFDCGHITDVGYPFWGDGRPDGCGLPDLKLNCLGNITTIEIMNVTYRVLAADPSSKILKIVREDYSVGGICSPDFVATTLDSQFFDYGPGYVNITLLYGCPPTYIPPLMTFPFSCTIDGIANKGRYIVDGAHGPESLCKKRGCSCTFWN
jgi:hypothetical protein